MLKTSATLGEPQGEFWNFEVDQRGDDGWKEGDERRRMVFLDLVLSGYKVQLRRAKETGWLNKMEVIVECFNE